MQIIFPIIVIVGAACVALNVSPSWRLATVLAIIGLAIFIVASTLALFESYTLADMTEVFLLQIPGRGDESGLLQLAAGGHVFLLAALFVAARRVCSRPVSGGDRSVG